MKSNKHIKISSSLFSEILQALEEKNTLLWRSYGKVLNEEEVLKLFSAIDMNTKLINKLNKSIDLNC